VKSGRARLADARKASLALESRFDLALQRLVFEPYAILVIVLASLFWIVRTGLG
jgi:hypothetical protein